MKPQGQRNTNASPPKEPEVALFRAALRQAAIDASFEPPPTGVTTTRRDHYSAISWFERAGRDYRFVCEMADLDPDEVRDEVLSGRFRERHGMRTRNR